MNASLPPVEPIEQIEPTIRQQLSRRSAGRLPEGLLGEVTAALDAAAAPRAIAARPRFAWTAPRLAGTAVAVGFVVLFVAAIAIPGWRGGATSSGSDIAGYPAGRALTTAELAAVLAGPALPINTTLVATVTIQARNDACPMDRYPTMGVVEGMPSQVCVMGAAIARDTTALNVSGTYAFRSLAPGYLGFLGEVTPASTSRLAFGPTQDWPTGGGAFVVEGWLGATGLLVLCPENTPNPGDVLAPNSEDCPYADWLGDGQTAPGIEADYVTNANEAIRTYDPLSLRGNARHVEAGGARIIDSIDPAKPVHGTFVVRLVTEACAGDPPTSTRACGAWRVLAKVADISLPDPDSSTSPEPSTSAVPTPTSVADSPAPPASLSPAATQALTGLIGPNNKPLTSAQLAALVDADPNHLAGRIAIVNGPVPGGFACGPATANASTSPEECQLVTLTGQIAGDGIWAVSIGTDGSLTIVGKLISGPHGLTFSVADGIPMNGTTTGPLLIMDAWLGGGGLGDACDIVGQPCDKSSTLGSGPNGREYIAQDGAVTLFQPAGTPVGVATRGLFLVKPMSPTTATCPTVAPPSARRCDLRVTILARLEAAAAP